MATVRILRSTTTGNTPPELVSGQIAINEADGKLFYRNAAGVVTQLATGGGSGLTWSSVPASPTATGAAGSIAYDNANGYFYVATAADSWKRAALSAWPSLPTIYGLQAWYDASDSASLFNATSGGSVVAAGGTVARWQDKSGNSRHLTQSTSGSRPTLIANGRNSLPILRFNASALDIASLSLPQPFTVFAVWKPTVTSAYLFDDLTRSGAFVVGGLRLDGPTSNEYYGVYAGSVLQSSGTYLNQWFASAAIVNGSSSSIFVNGTQAAAGAAGASAMVSLRLGARYDLGFSGSDLAEVLIYGSALSSTDRAAVEAYLTQKWAIS